MRTFVATLVALGLCGIAHGAAAATIEVTVDGRSGPWQQDVNPTLPYDLAALAPTIVRSTTGLLAAGTAYTIAVTGGETQTVSSYSKTDGLGYRNIQTGIGTTSYYVAKAPGETAYLQELMGAFADGTGKVIGSPFLIGNAGTFFAPAGAGEILLGINDNHYADNLGALTVSVSGTNISAVPLPGAAPLLGTTLMALAGFGVVANWRKARATA